MPTGGDGMPIAKGSVGPMRGEPLYHASLDPEEYESLLADNGFVVHDHVLNDPQCRRTVWLAQRTD